MSSSIANSSRKVRSMATTGISPNAEPALSNPSQNNSAGPAPSNALHNRGAESAPAHSSNNSSAGSDSSNPLHNRRAEPAPSHPSHDRGSEAAPAHPLRNRYFRLWWIGASISLLGDQFYLVALPWVVLQITGSGVAMGTVAMAAGIPRAVLMLLGGAATDRTSPRYLLMATASARTIFVAAIGALLWLHRLELWHIYVLAVAFGTADAFALPSAGAMLRSLVQPEQLPAA